MTHPPPAHVLSTTSSPRRRRVRTLLVAVAVFAATVTAWAEWPSPERAELLSPGTSAVEPTVLARVVVHVGRSGFAWRVARAVARGLTSEGVATVIASTSSPLARARASDRAVVYVAPTYWWAPAWTVARAVTRPRLSREVIVLPIVTASGQGDRALSILRARAVRSGGTVLDGLALYRARPNSEAAARGGDNAMAAESLAFAAGQSLARRVRGAHR